MDNQLFYDLVNRYIDGTATDEEKLLVESYYQQLASENAALPDGRMPVLKDLIYKNEATVEVLGTHFNVNSYVDEDAVRVTLLEGSVKVQSSVVQRTPSGVSSQY
jgi:hypothetical protein